MGTKFKITTYLPATPAQIYQAWLNGKEHSKMTGGKASGTPETGAKFSAWDGYISGRNLELIPDKKIVQAWRTTEFNENDQDSRLEIQLNAKDTGCELILLHSEIPDNQPDYESGWEEHYFKPMRAYFE